MSYEELLENYNKLQLKYENTKLELDNLKRIVFGVKREYTPKQEQLENSVQCSLFDKEKEVDEELQKQVEETVEELTVYRKKNKRKTVAGIKKEQLKNTEIQVIEYKLNPEEKCPECGNELEEVSKEIVRKEITYIPAKILITNYVQYTYKCKKCGTKESENASSTFVKTQVPKALLAHSFASPSLSTEVIYQKYYLGVPLYRQEKMWDDKGLVLPRNMMANWNIKISEYYLENLYKLMHKKMKAESELLHCDESTMQCNKEVGRKATSNSYMWVLSSGELEKQKGVIFKYSPSRSAETAKEFLKDYKGILVTDGRIPLTNSLAERAIRPFAVHRKNWRFADSVEGAKANAVYYSLIESAKLNNLNIEKYIKYLLDTIPQMDNPSNEKELERYLPWSKELPNEILNFQGTYEELKLNND